MGLGRFGGGLGVTRWLAREGARVLVTDLLPRDRLAQPVSRLRDLLESGSVELRLGQHALGDFTDADLVVANPAVARPWDNRFLRAADAAGVPITTEIALLTERLDRTRVIGVTGTAGKSTTASLIATALRAAGRTTHLGGNLGGSLLEQLPSIGARDWVVLELSSAMLFWLGPNPIGSTRDGWSPAVAIITSLTPNHVDWHGSIHHYRESKLNICRFQQPGDTLIIPDHPELVRITEPFRAGRRLLSIDDDASDPIPAPALDEMTLIGAHNRRNARLALLTAHLLAHPKPDAARAATRAVADFPGLPHRLRTVARHRGLRYIDDSKATTPDAAVRAIQALAESGTPPHNVHLIAGGYDKRVDLTPLLDAAGACAGLYAIGATARALCERAAPSDDTFDCGTLDRAVMLASARAQPGHVILLSPGCASWDQFDDFEHRGRAFAQAADRLASPGEAAAG